MRAYLLIAAAVCLGAAPAYAQKPDAPAAGDAAAGARLYQAYGCYTCHGTTGAGGEPTGPRLAPGTYPMPAFLHQLRYPRSKMPPFSDRVLSDQQAADIHAYLASIPAGKPAKDIPLLH